MTELRAGFGMIELSVNALGVELVGCGEREGGAAGVHDPLFARVMVLEVGADRVALCGLDLCYVSEGVVAKARDRIAARGLVPADALFVAASHTHSGPDDTDVGCFRDGLDALIEGAVAEACERLEPARIGVGWGMLHGHALNRRRLEDPVDPAVTVLRVDAVDGRSLGIAYSYACHPVILGADNLLVSADWPGVSSRELEAQLGGEAVALFLQGCAADVNPVTPEIRKRIASSPAVSSTAQLFYYGSPEQGSGNWDRRFGAIWDRAGGTFGEVDVFGGVVADEVRRVHRGIAEQDVERVWTRRLAIQQPVEPPVGGPIDPGNSVMALRELVRTSREQPVEVMLIGIDGPGIVLVGQPGEVFADTGVRLRRELRQAGVRHPLVVGYANGFRAYLPPAHAFPDAGYEVEWAWALGLPETLQEDIREAVLEAARSHSNAPM